MSPSTRLNGIKTVTLTFSQDMQNFREIEFHSTPMTGDLEAMPATSCLAIREFNP